ncbi:hypothetical protein A2645_01400 [Candidatus Nomurabacteria bacterium RIFCSPHIGHO2_01_FULL_39_9]|uniref:Glycosyltransferase 2-like domain-containing protein n=1 Tax=Candidatus Nomurabacteria bacterium RIFCSPHIGHO2_01_FULL_39_9 TaxID=1801735 RepID=A0A1F6UY85_9BACT|nr:MAG: hypothetical protein A2645_01400 [Candidatus Nomurabacteria bacterium RIFCSPHIGHO2_01_FULL_39_9]
MSVVIPVFNEAEAIPNLYEKISKTFQDFKKPAEIIFVNDGSTDNTLEVLKNFNQIKIINFRRNFGQTAALDAGIKAARGKYVATLDGDGQNDPKDIPMLVNKLESENLDAVCGWRKNRKDPVGKKTASHLAAWLRKILLNDGIHDSGCTLRVYRRECFDHVDLYGEMHRFIPALLRLRGFKIGEMEVSHQPRLAGKTKYNWRRGVKGVLDMFSVWFWKKYRSRPLHLFGSVGFLSIFAGLILVLFIIYEKVFRLIDLSDTAFTILAVFLFLAGIQFIVFGILADIGIKNYYGNKCDSSYMIKEIIEK